MTRLHWWQRAALAVLDNPVLAAGGFGALALGLAIALSGCSAPRCQVPVDVALTRHPDGLPRPAAAVLVSCSDPVWARQYVCAAVDVSPTGLWCDGERKIDVSP